MMGLGLTGNLLAILAFVFICGLGTGILVPLIQSAILNVVGPQASSRAMGVAFGCLFLGQFLQPFEIAPLRSTIGIQQTFIAVGLATAVVGAGLLLKAALTKKIRVVAT